MGSGISASRKSAANVTDVTTVRLDDTPAGPAAVCNPQYETPVPENDRHAGEFSPIPEEIEYPPRHANHEHVVPMEGEVGLAIAMTPREFEKSSGSNSFSGVPYTPHGEEASIFKYYCPLCMQYFKQIMKMKCCGNYMCVQCCKDYVERKGVHLAPHEGVTHIEDRFISPNSIYCPHCQVSGFHPIGVSFEEAVRDYQINNVAPQDRGIAAYSPLRVGETFEDLKRKMIPYKSFQIIKTISDDGTHNSEMVQLDDPLSPAYLVEHNVMPGIAMVHGAGDETPIFRSPRMRLEPDTPGQMQFSLYHPDEDAGAGGNRLFQEDHSGPFTQDLMVANNNASIEGRLECTASERNCERPPLSRVGSSVRVITVNDVGGSSSRQGSEKALMRGQCSHLATNLIEQWMGSALAQYPAVGNTECEASQ